MKALLFLSAGLMLLCGCKTPPGPAVSLVNVRLHQSTAFETTATFTLRLSNQTPQPMQLEGGVYKIYLNGLYVGEGLNNETMNLPRLATATQEVTVHLSNLRMVTRIKPILESTSFEYRIKSLLYGAAPAGRLRSEDEGWLNLKDFTSTPK